MSKKSQKGKIKVPKRVAGIKIPKTVRKGPVVDFVNSTTGRVLIAEALTAAIAAFAVKNSDSAPAQKIKAGVSNAQDSVKQNAARLSYAFGEAVRAFREALSDPSAVGEVVGQPVGDEASVVEPEVVAKKKPRSSRPESATAQL
jgi:hypothetical protein